jgi:hypothetical protein
MMKRINVFAVVGLVGCIVTGLIQTIATYFEIGVGHHDASDWYMYYLPWFVFLVIGFVQSLNAKSHA